MSQDAILSTTNTYYDFNLTSDGQIEVDDFFDTALLYSLLGEKRADDSEISSPELQRGWIGNENRDFENGSKLWLYSQASLTRTILNNVSDAAFDALQWLVEDGLAVSIDNVSAIADGNSIFLQLTIKRAESITVSRTFELWNNTGIR